VGIRRLQRTGIPDEDVSGPSSLAPSQADARSARNRDRHLRNSLQGV
jgi:hypothetical protein